MSSYKRNYLIVISLISIIGYFFINTEFISVSDFVISFFWIIGKEYFEGKVDK